MQNMRLLIAHGSDDILAAIEHAVGQRHAVVARAGTVAELRRAVLRGEADLVIAGVEFPDGDGLDTLIDLSDTEPLPAVIVTQRRSLDLVAKAMRDHVMAYLIEPVEAADLHAALVVAWSRYTQLRELEDQVGDLRQALADRKLIERAKGILMADQDIGEGMAFGEMRRRAQDTRTKLTEVARTILAEHAERDTDSKQR